MPSLWDVDDSFPQEHALKVATGFLDVGEHQIKGLITPASGSAPNATWIRVTGSATRLPAELKKLRQLKALTLRFEPHGDESLELEDALSSLEELEFLGIHEARISALPKSLASLPNLRAVELLGATVSDSALWDVFAEMPKLEHVSLRETRWSGPLPESVDGLACMKSLEIAAGVQRLPKSIRNVSQLEKLVLVGTYTQLPSDLRELKMLRKLELRGAFTQLPPDLAELKKLESFQLQSGKARVEMKTGSPGVHLDPDDLEWMLKTFEEELTKHA
jgi:hypothetical protein